jgi:CubicO group peptidase (beta-lactamase class C family)
MTQLIQRRAILAGGAALAASHLNAYHFETKSSSAVDEAMRASMARRKVPAAVAMFADGREILYSGAFGKRDSAGPALPLDAIFNIASMTKAITTVAALQLVEQGKVSLTEPVSTHLPELANLEVLHGFDDKGKPVLRPLKTPITLKHLLTHTSGLAYDIWDPRMFRYTSALPAGAPPAKPGPLVFEPGARWQYGQGIDWAGKLVEKLSGANLEDYFQQNILKPLGMVDTTYILPESKFDRMVSRYSRSTPGAELEEAPRTFPARPANFNGGGGQLSTAGDYIKFMQMILNRGAGANNARILKPETVDMMMMNQIGSSFAGKMKSSRLTTSADVDIQPGQPQRWTFGFLTNLVGYPGGRSAGSLAWGGIFNTFYWIDPKKNRCGVLMMQFLPFVDKEAIGLLDDFEKAAYKNL